MYQFWPSLHGKINEFCIISEFFADKYQYPKKILVPFEGFLRQKYHDILLHILSIEKYQYSAIKLVPFESFLRQKYQSKKLKTRPNGQALSFLSFLNASSCDDGQKHRHEDGEYRSGEKCQGCCCFVGGAFDGGDAYVHGRRLW